VKKIKKKNKNNVLDLTFLGEVKKIERELEMFAKHPQSCHKMSETNRGIKLL
jgi:hypothetical protein